MLHRILVALAFAVAAQAVTVPMPIPGTGRCKPSAATNATPIRVTVVSISACGIVENSLIYVSGMLNGTWQTDTNNKSSANSHFENSTDDIGLYRCAKNVSGNSFDLYKGDCTTAVAGTGTYGAGGLIWRVSLKTISTSGLLPLADSTILAGLQSTAAGGWANSSRTLWQAVSEVGADVVGTAYSSWSGAPWSYSMGMVHAAPVALYWLGSGKPSGSTRTRLITMAQEPEAYWPSFACDEAEANCDQADTVLSDYLSSLYLVDYLFALNAIWSELSAGEKTKILEYFLTDITWSRGGHGATGVAPTKPAFIRRSASYNSNTYGTVSSTAGSGTITISGSTFTGAPAVSVGDVIMIPAPRDNVNATQHKILSVSSGSITVEPAVPSTYTNVGYYIGPIWTSGQAGYLWHSKHYDVETLCGMNIHQTAAFGCTDYVRAGLQYGVESGAQNHMIGRQANYIALGATFAEHSIAARHLLAEASGLMYHYYYPTWLGIWAGVGPSSTIGYAQQRTHQQTLLSLGILKFATGDDYAEPGFVSAIQKWQLGQKIPGIEDYNVSQEYAFSLSHLGHSYPGNRAMLFWPSGTEAPQVKSWNESWANWTKTNMKANLFYLTTAYIGHRPDITAATRTDTTITYPALTSYCTAIWGSDCVADAPRVGLMSSTGTFLANSTSPVWWMNAHSFSTVDHGAQSAEFGLRMAVNGKRLLAADGSNFYATSSAGATFPTIALSGFTLRTTGNGKTTVSRLGGDVTVAGGTFDFQNHYTSTPSGPVLASFLHGKKGSGPDYVLMRYDLPSTGSVRFHYRLSDGSCGTPSSSSCISFAKGTSATMVHTISGAARALSSFFGGNTTTEADSNTDGSYSGGLGFTFRVQQTSSGAGTLYSVHRGSSDTAITMPTLTAITAGNLGGYQIGDDKVLLAAGATAQSSTTSFSTSHSGTVQYAVLGLAAGNWNFKRNGSTVCATVVVASGQELATCDMQSGTIQLESAGASPPSITTSSPLPGGTNGTPYSQNFAATGGSPAYTWAVTAGTLCTGLSLSSGGALTGTPTTNQTCNFTVQVTDSIAQTDADAFSLTISAAGSAPPRGASGRVVFTGRTILQ